MPRGVERRWRAGDERAHGLIDTKEPWRLIKRFSRNARKTRSTTRRARGGLAIAEIAAEFFQEPRAARARRRTTVPVVCASARAANRRAGPLRAVVARATTCAMAMSRRTVRARIGVDERGVVNEADAAFVHAGLATSCSSRAAPGRGARHRRAERRAAQAAPREHRRQPARGAVHAAQLELQRRGDDRGARVHQAAHRDGPERRGQHEQVQPPRGENRTRGAARARTHLEEVGLAVAKNQTRNTVCSDRHAIPHRDAPETETRGTDHGARLHPNA